MGLFSAKKQLPTDTHLASLNNATQPSTDPEKGSTDEHDVVAAGGGAGHQHHHVDPVIEKRVVRKLDLTVTPLVAGLCKCCDNEEIFVFPTRVIMVELIRYDSSALLPGSRKHRQCEDCRHAEGSGSHVG